MKKYLINKEDKNKNIIKEDINNNEFINNVNNTNNTNNTNNINNKNNI